MLPDRIGRYEINAEVASGGMATVFLARLLGPAGFDKLVALKCVHAHLSKDPTFIEMFLDEARLVSRIRHPRVCSVFDVGYADGRYYLAMDFLEGVSLAQVIQKLTGGTVPVAQRCLLAATFIAQACEGLHAAHELLDEHGQPLQVVHRDVSPQNLFVTWDGHLQVVDFGIAHATGRMHQTLSTSLKGKLAYMSPEQLQDGDVDRRTDVWALGVVLWEALTLRRLFRKRTEPGTMHAVLEGPVPPPSTVDPGVPPELDRIVLRALNRDPHERYPTTRAFAKELNRFASSWGVPMGASEIAELMEQLMPDERRETRQMVAGVRNMPRAEVTPASATLPGSRSVSLPLVAVGTALLGAAIAVGLWLALVPQSAGNETPEPPEPRAPVVAASPATANPIDVPTEVAMETVVETPVADPVVVEPARMRSMRSRPRRAEMQPTMTEAMETVMESTRMAVGNATLTVATPGAWADVRIDGRPSGRTPTERSVTIGSHSVELDFFGEGRVVRRRVDVTGDTRLRVPAPD